MTLCEIVHPRGFKCSLEHGHDGNHKPRLEHYCHAFNCGVAVKPEMLMCYKHWRMVPKDIQQKVWRYYRPGQCDDMNISKEWLSAADEAIAAVKQKENL